MNKEQNEKLEMTLPLGQNEEAAFSEETKDMPWAAVLCNENGSILAKNPHADVYKIFRLRSKITRLIAVSERNDFLRCVSEGEAKVFDCEKGSGFSYALTLPSTTGAQTVRVFWISSLMTESGIFGNDADVTYNHYRHIDELLKTYREERRKLTDVEDERAAALSENNALCIRRSTHHLDLHMRSVLPDNAKETEPSVMLNLLDNCQKMMERFRAHHTKYTVAFEPEIAPAAISIPAYLFANVFMGIVTLSLRLAHDDSTKIRMTETEKDYIFTATFRLSETAAAVLETLEIDVQFLQALCGNAGWQFEISSNDCGDGMGRIRFFVPKEYDNETVCRNADTFFISELYALVDEEMSVLYFA